jgi:cupin superfamily acireductone dioxygenase involved in methionine salvage
VKNSPDGVYHWCSVAGANDSKTICLFVPPKGY